MFYYTIIVVPIFSSLSPSTQHTPLPQAIPPIVGDHGTCVSVLIHFLHSTLHPHGYSVTTYWYFILSPVHPLPHTSVPSGNHQEAVCTHDSVSVLRVCLVCVLDSIVHRHVFFCHFIVHSFNLLFLK